MEVLKEQLKGHERRITILEEHRESDIKLINENNKNLATIIVELKNLTKSMDTLANNWKEAINRSNARQKERDDNTDKRISSLEKNVEKLNSKLEAEAKFLDDKVDERTIGKASKDYNKIKMTVITCILTSILGFILGMILK